MSVTARRDYRSEIIPNNLTETRESRGLTLEVVAGVLGLEVASLSRYERGRRNVPDALKIHLAYYYDVPVSQLFPLARDITESVNRKEDES